MLPVGGPPDLAAIPPAEAPILPVGGPASPPAIPPAEAPVLPVGGPPAPPPAIKSYIISQLHYGRDCHTSLIHA